MQQPHRHRRKKNTAQLVVPLLLAALAVFLLLRWLSGSSTQGNYTQTGALPSADESTAQMVESWPGTAPYIIAVDSGHGGQDTGASGLLDELEVTVPTAEYLIEWLEQDENFTPIRTHEADVFAKPAERREAAQNAGAKLLFSIHGNANTDSTQLAGFEIYTENKNKPFSAQSYALAQQLANAFTAAGHTPQAGSGIFYCHYEGSDESGYDKFTVPEAKEQEYALTGQSFGVLESDQMPAVLVEQGYLTNASDVATWLSTEGCKKAARLYYESICALFGTQPIAQ